MPRRTFKEMVHDVGARLDWRDKYGGATAENPDLILILEALEYLLTAEQWQRGGPNDTSDGE